VATMMVKRVKASPGGEPKAEEPPTPPNAPARPPPLPRWMSTIRIRKRLNTNRTMLTKPEKTEAAQRKGGTLTARSFRLTAVRSQGWERDNGKRCYYRRISGPGKS